MNEDLARIEHKMIIPQTTSNQTPGSIQMGSTLHAADSRSRVVTNLISPKKDKVEHQIP